MDRQTTAAEIGDELFDERILPFEAISLVLLAALIGAIVLARRDDPDHVNRRDDDAGEAAIATGALR